MRLLRPCTGNADPIANPLAHARGYDGPQALAAQSRAVVKVEKTTPEDAGDPHLEDLLEMRLA